MYKILDRQPLTGSVYRFEIEAPEISSKARAGQFVMLMVEEEGERIPLTIADWDEQRGTVSVVVSQVGTTTGKLAGMQKGDQIPHFCGPLGKPVETGEAGNVVCVAMGYGMATIIPVARQLVKTGSNVFSIISAPSKNDLFCEQELKQISREIVITTSDGSEGEKGWVIEPLKQMIENRGSVNQVFAIGSLCMMKLVSSTTKQYRIKTSVSLNPIMVDGTGMCGACRVSVGGATKFGCVDGPEFDGHKVDWELLMARRCTYPAPIEQCATQYRCQFCGQW